ncbi:uncharacterized protein LOC130894203 isoform X1 [Diorhabda carinulata]|uniref:uncharacterized protein LOC130894203 isoform X1 n=1 Tax=Diorhabda carinulata TaxID=1163345 RepID=UPI0025A1C599|nr:uncharacterized protein LOC130894203 isoform X1 [Diorhabda carinulata]XP_057656824.1 uncharacterized protein LOC130894203 isoform X1 [Diorhabda carinulata]
MLARSTSSRRRRASRSAASSPQTRGLTSTPSPGRRASIAVTPAEPDHFRNTLAPEISRSQRNSLIPDISETQILKDKKTERTNRPTLAPEFDRSPRNSLLPDSQKSPRHSLVPTDHFRCPSKTSLSTTDYVLSPRNSISIDFNRSPRNSLVPEHSRSPRHSLTPETNVYSSKLNVAEFNRSPRNSLVPESTRVSRRSLTEAGTWRQDEGIIAGRGHRHNFSSETLPKRTNRSNNGDEYEDRSPRGSIGPELDENRSPRGSIARSMFDDPEKKSPRGSLTLTFHEPLVTERRASSDNGIRVRSTSPYRVGGGSRSGAAISGLSENGSRRASSSVSQVSGDEQRRLCVDHNNTETQNINLALSLTTYGSVAYQLKDANLESSGTCDFVCKALHIVNKTVVVTVALVCLSVLPIMMLIMGIHFLRDCPREPNIPIYMIVGGSVGCVKMSLTLWSQFYTSRTANSGNDATSIVSKIASIALTILLIAWFALGNYWIFKIIWPDYAPTLFEPNKWCHKALYVFSLVHLCVVYALFGTILILVIVLASCQLFECSWLGPVRYK